MMVEGNAHIIQAEPYDKSWAVGLCSLFRLIGSEHDFSREIIFMILSQGIQHKVEQPVNILFFSKISLWLDENLHAMGGQ